MQLKICRVLALAVFLFAGLAQAELPNPNSFAWAVERGDVKKVKEWFDQGLDPEFVGNQIGTGLMIAAWQGNIEMMALFVERGANPRRANRNGEQPLQLAAWKGHMEAVKWLLAHGASLNREGKQWGALHYAVFNGHDDLAKYLLAQGAHVNATSPNGSTPLMLAAREGREELAKVLLESGGDTKAKNDWGDTPLIMAMRYDHYKLGKMISSPEEFDIAVKAPKESFGVASRSAPASAEIEELLRKIREAEAEGRPSEELHKQLRDAVNAFRRNAMAQKASRRPMPLPYQPKTLVITAKRGKPGAERAQVLVDGKSATFSAASVGDSKASSIKVTPVDQQAKQSKVADLMRQIRLAEADGQPTDKLREQLAEALEALNR